VRAVREVREGVSSVSVALLERRARRAEGHRCLCAAMGWLHSFGAAEIWRDDWDQILWTASTSVLRDTDTFCAAAALTSSALGATTESRGARKIGVRAPACLASRRRLWQPRTTTHPTPPHTAISQQPLHPCRAAPNEVRTIAVVAVISRPGSQSALRSMVREETRATERQLDCADRLSGCVAACVDNALARGERLLELPWPWYDGMFV
jgi:hypothetical protein